MRMPIGSRPRPRSRAEQCFVFLDRRGRGADAARTDRRRGDGRGRHGRRRSSRMGRPGHFSGDRPAQAVRLADDRHADGRRRPQHRHCDICSMRSIRSSLPWGLRCSTWLRPGSAQSHEGLGQILGFAAGAFVCIATSDLLPELQFHRHDRATLSAALVAGIALAWGTVYLEGGHDHSHGSRACARGRARSRSDDDRRTRRRQRSTLPARARCEFAARARAPRRSPRGWRRCSSTRQERPGDERHAG